MTELSILIPSRNEMFLNRTVTDLLANSEADTEIIVALDGAWPEESLQDHPSLSLLRFPVAIGQRAATNAAARIARGTYLMKIDAHCTVDTGFDLKLLDAIEPDMTLVPTMKNLHAFDWACEGCEWRKYQGPTPPACPQCGGPVKRDIVWRAKPSPNSKSYCFDAEPHFQYFGQYNKRPEGKGDLTETMSLQGSCWMLHRDKYFELDICDESIGSWGSQGIEVACKTWLSGGRCMCLQTTWYAHLFRTQGGDFGFPYPLNGSAVDHAKATVRRMFFEGGWRGRYPLSWLVERFWPVPGWTDEDLAALKEAGC